MLLSTSFLLALTTASLAKNFGEDGLDYVWADTPRGKFECISDSSVNRRQLLKLDGKIIFQQSERSAVPTGEGYTLAEGIYIGPDEFSNFNSMCPSIVANNSGYVIISRRFAGISENPDVYGYAVIDFSVMPPYIANLVEVHPKDAIDDKGRFTWDKKGFTMRYYGYPPNSGPYSTAEGKTTPAPKHHVIRYDFESCIVTQIK